MANHANDVGAQGESIFQTRISQGHRFRVGFLGEKAPIEDFMLEINDEATPYQCLVQVKSTEQGNDSNNNLKASIDADKYQKLLNRPLPTYIAGVDVNNETVYLTEAFDKTKKTSSIPTTYKLDVRDKATSLANIRKLEQDIIDYWQGSKILVYKQSFKSSLK